MPTRHPGDRSGHDLEPRHRVRWCAQSAGDRSAGIPADLSGARLGRARSGGDLVERGCDRARGACASRPRRRRTSPRSASPISARPRVIWDRATGKPIHNAIVWQDRRTDECLRDAAQCRPRSRPSRHAPDCCSIRISPRPRSPGCSIMSKARAPQPRRANSPSAPSIRFLLWRLTGGSVHATDATNAARTLLFDIHSGQWDRELAELLRVPLPLLPEVRDCAA